MTQETAQVTMGNLPAAPAGAAVLQILVVDDEANIRSTLGLCLDGRPHGAKIVSDVEGARGRYSCEGSHVSACV